MRLIAITRPDFFEGESGILNALFEAGLEVLHLRKPGAGEAEMRSLVERIEGRFRDRVVLHSCFDLAPELGLRGVHPGSRNPDRQHLAGHARTADFDATPDISPGQACDTTPDMNSGPAFDATADMNSGPVCDTTHDMNSGPACDAISSPAAHTISGPAANTASNTAANTAANTDPRPAAAKKASTKVLSVSRSCHSFEEVEAALDGGCDYVFLSPVFDSISKPGYGSAFTPEQLQWARARGIINRRVVALGGIDAENIPVAALCGFGGVAVLGALWGDDSGNPGEVARRFEKLRNACTI